MCTRDSSTKRNRADCEFDIWLIFIINLSTVAILSCEIEGEMS